MENKDFYEECMEIEGYQAAAFFAWEEAGMKSAAEIIRNIGNVSDTPEGEGIHANVFNAVVKEWLEKYDG